MLHAVSPTWPPSKGSISLSTLNIEECHKVKDTVIKAWSSDRYRVSANCIFLK